MEKHISKELLSEVLSTVEYMEEKLKNKPINEQTTLKLDDGILYIDFEDKHWTCINIHELAHKYKEWAVDKGYKYHIETNMKNLNQASINMVLVSKYKSISKIELAITELKNKKEHLNPLYDFKACQWLYNELKG